MNYNLKMKYKGERGYWHTYISADNDEDAIKKAERHIRLEKNKIQKLEKAILEKSIIKYKKVKELELNV